MENTNKNNTNIDININTNTNIAFKLSSFLKSGRDKLKDKFKNIFNKQGNLIDQNSQDHSKNPQNNQSK
jgi:hypothetical protein